MEKAAAKPKATDADRRAACAAKAELKPLLDQIAGLEATLAPYEQIKRDLSAARTRFRKLTDEFVSELRNRCGFMGEDKKRILVLELFAEDVQSGLDGAVSEKQQVLVQFVEGLWDKYHRTLAALRNGRSDVENELVVILTQLGFA